MPSKPVTTRSKSTDPNFRCEEAPATKIYPPKKIGNTKMRPFVDWWRILRPIFLVGLGIRK